jgi:hypothetical protein
VQRGVSGASLSPPPHWQSGGRAVNPGEPPGSPSLRLDRPLAPPPLRLPLVAHPSPPAASPRAASLFERRLAASKSLPALVVRNSRISRMSNIRSLRDTKPAAPSEDSEGEEEEHGTGGKKPAQYYTGALAFVSYRFSLAFPSPSRAAPPRHPQAAPPPGST